MSETLHVIEKAPETADKASELEAYRKKRNMRQQDIVPDALKEVNCTVIGVGAVGRQIALQLATMGATFLNIFDFDTVEPENVGAQGYAFDDIGQPKVDIVERDCLRLLKNVENVRLQKVSEAFGFSHTSGFSPEGLHIIFCCVDSIDTRKMIWESLGKTLAAKNGRMLFIDGRMAAETFRVLTDEKFGEASPYGKTLFTKAEAFAGACTAKTTFYCASAVAAFMVAQAVRWLRKYPICEDQQINLLADEMTVGAAKPLEMSVPSPKAGSAVPATVTTAPVLRGDPRPGSSKTKRKPQPATT